MRAPMNNLQNQNRTLSRARSVGTTLLLFGVALFTGCTFSDVFTARFYKELTSDPDPYDVLEKSTDGNKRAKALAKIQEPSRNGGSQEQQDLVVELLNHAASNEPEFWPRLNAIRAMSHFKDPRIVEGLMDAYYARSLKDYPQESGHILRVSVINAIGKIGHPNGMELLTAVLDQPPIDPETSEQKKKQAHDERIAAAHALENFRSKESVALLNRVLEKERNVALRNRARQSLQVVQGIRPGSDAPVIEKVIDRITPSRDAIAEDNTSIREIRPVSGEQR